MLLILVVVLIVGLATLGLAAGFGATTRNSVHRAIHKTKEIYDKLVDVCAKLTELSDQHREILEAIEERNCETVGVPTDDGCIFSSQDILTARALANAYLRKTNGLYGFFGTFSAAEIHSTFPKLEYAKTPGDQASYALLQEVRAVIQAIDDAEANPQTTDAEKYSMSPARIQMERDVRLLELNFYQSALAQFDWSWEWDIYHVDFIGPLLFPFSAGDSIYDDKILELVFNMEQAYIDRRVYLLDVLSQDSPPHVWPNISCHAIPGEMATVSSPGWRDPLCDAIGDAGKKAACFAQLPNLQAAFDSYSTFFVGPMCDASATWRPDTSPGLGNVHNGNETYAAWNKYHTGTTLTPAEIKANGIAAEVEIIANVEALTGDTFATFASEKSDPTNPKYSICFDTDEQTRAYYAAELDVIGEQVLTTQYGYGVRTISYVDSNPTFCCALRGGAYDKERGIYLEPFYFVWDYTGTNDTQNCISRYNTALHIHEVHGGHGTHLIALENHCDFEGLYSFLTFFWEGNAHYAERACLDTNLCDEPLKQAAGYWGDRILRASRLVVDPDIHANGGDPADCVARYTSNGEQPGLAYSECVVRYPQLPGQANAYRVGADFFQDQRDLVEAALGSDFDVKEFHMLVVKFGQASFEQVSQLVQTYIVWRQDRNAAVGMPLFELIDQQLWRNSAVVLAAGWESPNSGAVIVDSVSSKTAKAAQIKSALAALPENVRTMIQNNPRLSRGGLRL